MSTDVSAAPSRFRRALRWCAARPKSVLLILCLLLWAPGVFSLPPLDRDESRFAQASKQMLETGNLIDIRFGSVPRYKKPVGIYWLQAAATEVAGAGRRDRIWTYRLPSLAGAVIAAWLALWCAGAFLDAEGAFLAAALFGATLLLAAEATIAATDAVLAACTLGAMGVLFRVYLAARDESFAPPGWKLVLAGWFAFAFGILVKGPVTPAVAFLTAIVLSLWDRDARWLSRTRPLWGIALTVLVVSPWVTAIALESHGAFFRQSLGHDFAGKLAGGQESHGAPPGYYLLLTTLAFWPGTLFLLPALGRAVRHRALPAIRFLIVWAGASWVLFEAVPTKLPHYVLPLYPALAMLAAAYALSPRQAVPRWQRILFWAALVQFALGVAAFVAAPILLPHLYGAGAPWWLVGLAALGGLLSLAAVLALWRGRNVAAFFAGLAAALVFYPTLTAGVGPRLTQFWIAPRLAAALRADRRPGDPPPVLAGYEEPSAVFLLGTDTRLAADGRAAADLGMGTGGLAAVEAGAEPAFLARLAEREADAAALSEVEGYNYSRGRPVAIRIYRVTRMRRDAAPPGARTP